MITRFYREKQCILHKGRWQDWYKTFKDQYAQKVNLICADPPYNVYEGLARDTITEEEMQEFVDAAWTMLHPRGTVVVFCSWQVYYIDS